MLKILMNNVIKFTLGSPTTFHYTFFTPFPSSHCPRLRESAHAQSRHASYGACAEPSRVQQRMRRAVTRPTAQIRREMGLSNTS